MLAQIAMCKPMSKNNSKEQNDTLGGTKRVKAFLSSFCSDKAHLTSFSWSNCSTRVHGNMKVRTMNQPWSTSIYTYKNVSIQAICTFVWVSKGLLTNMEATHLQEHFTGPFLLAFLSTSLPFFICLLCFSLFFPFILVTRDTISFHSSPSPSQYYLSKEPQTEKRPKKVKLLIWCHCQLEPREERSSTERRQTESEPLVSHR